MYEEIKDSPKFAYLIGKSLLHEALTDPEAFCLALSGLCLGSRSSRLRGLGIILGGWFITRRADAYIRIFDSNAKLLAQLMIESIKRGANE